MFLVYYPSYYPSILRHSRLLIVLNTCVCAKRLERLFSDTSQTLLVFILLEFTSAHFRQPSALISEQIVSGIEALTLACSALYPIITTPSKQPNEFRSTINARFDRITRPVGGTSVV